uniref:C-type lectin domain-containing protein n=1 Tax=Poecilia formosa TaxID=48698 RepID=A0A096LS11_POEFO
MEDSEVQYATVVFKNLPRTKKEEEVVYDEVKKTNQTSQQTFDTNDMEAERRHWYQKFACCFGSLCVILVMMIIGVYNLTQQKQNLTEELSQVKKTNQELQTDKETLTRQIETMKKTWNEQKLRIRNEYCHRRNNERSSSCQNGWTHCQSSCYAVNNARPPKGKTWTEAQEDCKQKTSHLAVVGSEEKKLFLDNTSWNANGITGYWIGLRAEGRRWKWINGSDLTHQAWMQQPATDGQCVTSLQNREWKSVRCTEKNAWICEKKALSV